MILTIYGRLPGLNEYTAACRSKSFLGASMKKDAEKTIGFYIRTQLKQKITGKAWVDFRWYEKDKRRDFDNIAFAKKFIFDALVSNEIITADSWKGVAGFTDNFFVDKDNPRIEVEIQEVECIR